MSPVARTPAQPGAPNGVGHPGRPLSLHGPAARIRCAVRECGGGFPHAVGSPVGPGRSDAHARSLWSSWGRCRPSPDRVSEGASPDRDARRIVPGHLASRCGQWFLPVLGAPPARVGGVDRDDRDVLLGGHRHQPGFQLRGGEAGEQAAEALVAAVLLAACALAEVEVLDGDRGSPACGGCGAAAGSGRAGSARPGARCCRSGRRRSGAVRRPGCRARPGARRRGGRRSCPPPPPPAPAPPQAAGPVRRRAARRR